jgi:hypothetical protein
MTEKSKAKVDERGHVEGSRKGKVHALYDKQGPEAAWTLGLKLKLSENTLRTWFGVWARDQKAKKAKNKPTPKSRKPDKVSNVTTPSDAPRVEVAS